MKTEHETILGRYIASLSPESRRTCGAQCSAIVFYFENGGELTKRSLREFAAANPEYVGTHKYTYICDLLYFAGVRTGAKRKPVKKTLTPKEEVNSQNEKMIAKFLIWLKSKRDYSPKTLAVHIIGMRDFFKYSDAFSQDHARMYINTLEEKKYAPQTLNIRIMTLQYWGQFIKKPIELKKYKIQRTLVLENVPTEREYNKLLEWCAEHSSSAYWIVRLLGSTGMRISELRQIKWGDVMEGQVYLNCKGSKYRYIFFPKHVQSEACEFAKKNGMSKDSKVVISRLGLPMSDRGIGQKLKAVAAKCGYPIEKAHCHAFRHFFAKMYLKKAGDVIQLSELLGHESIDTTRIYLQKSKQEHIRDVNKNVTW